MKSMNHIIMCFILCFCLFISFSLRAQTTCYETGYPDVCTGTEDSRLVATIEETRETVTVRIMGIGEMHLDVAQYSIYFNQAVLYLTNSTFDADYSTQTGASVEILKNSIKIIHPEMATKGWTIGTPSQRVASTTANTANSGRADMRAFIPSVSRSGATPETSIHIGKGAMVVLYECYFKKVTPGQSLTTDDFGVGAQGAGLSGRYAPKWAYSGTLEYVYTSGAGKTTIPQYHFPFRTASSVSIDPEPVSKGATEVTLSGVFSSGKMTPYNALIDASGSQTTGNGILDRDSVKFRGFIYTDDPSVTSIAFKEFSDVIIVNGISECPLPGTSGSFTCGGKELILKISANANNNQGVDLTFSEKLTNLIENKEYTGWAVMRYKFETSNLFTAVSGPINFTPAADLSCPAYAIWTAAANSSDWNNPLNWNAKLNVGDVDYTTDLIPGKCTYVVIPGNLTYYPVLSSSTAPVAQCDTIDFKYGGEVVGTPFLDYEAAKVELTLNNSRWYMLAPPLLDMYSGDYRLIESIGRRNPAVSMMQYQADNPQYSEIMAQAGKWSNTFNTLGVPLKLVSGFASKVNLNETAANKDYTFNFPQDSLNYVYYDRNTTLPTGNSTFLQLGKNMERADRHRFIYEKQSGYESGTFSAAIENGTVTTYDNVIIGNPFMAHLDLTRFYLNENNINYLSGTFRIWTWGNTTEVYKYQYIDTDGDGIADSYAVASTEEEIGVEQSSIGIAPMQSVWVERKSGASFSDLTFSTSMTLVDPVTKLRTAAVSPFHGKLNIKVSRDGQRESGAVIIYQKGADNGYSQNEDALVFLITNLENKVATVYSAIDGKAAAINMLGDLSENIELGITTSEKGELTLDFWGMESFNMPYRIELVDRMNGSQDLRENPSYTFMNETGNVEGRFFLRFTPMGSTGMESSVADSGIYMYSENGYLYVCSKDILRQVEVMNLQGQSLYKQSGLNSARVEIPLPVAKQVLIVKAQTELKTQTGKVFLK